jgi:hypothetical protein
VTSPTVSSSAPSATSRARASPAASRSGPLLACAPARCWRKGAKVGNFVEVKNAVLGEGAKANHLTYLGDARSARAPTSARARSPAITTATSSTRPMIGERAFIGSNSALIAPVKIGADAIVAAGSAVSRDVADGELRMVRGEQLVKPGWADRFHDAMKKKKAETRQVRHEIPRISGGCRCRASAFPTAKAFSLMCGIIGIVGKEQSRSGWSMASGAWNTAAMTAPGVCTVHDGELVRRRAEGKLNNLVIRTGPRSRARHCRHRPHPLGDPRRADRQPMPIRTRRRSGAGPQRHHRELQAAARSTDRAGPHVRKRDRYRVVAHLVSEQVEAGLSPRMRSRPCCRSCAAPSRWPSPSASIPIC